MAIGATPQEDIAELLKSMAPPAAAAAAPAPDESTQPKQDPEPASPAPAAPETPTPAEPPAPAPEAAPETPSAEVVPVAEPGAPEVSSEAQIDYKALYDATLAALNEQSGELLELRQGAPPPTPPAVQAPAVVPTVVVPPTQTPLQAGTPVEFVSPADFDAALTHPESFNKLLNTVARKSSETAIEGARESVLRGLPKLVSDMVSHQLQSRIVGEEFFKANADMQAVPQNVFEAVFQAVGQQKPGAPLYEQLNATRDLIRQKGLVPRSAAKGVTAPARGAASLPGGSAQRSAAPPKPQLNAVQEQIKSVLEGRG